MEFDCQTCGACCVSPRESASYVGLAPRDVRRLRRHRLPLVQTGAAPAPTELGTKTNGQGLCVCVALRGKVAAWSACGVYQDRPTACREFRRGSPECLQARWEAGIGDAA